MGAESKQKSLRSQLFRILGDENRLRIIEALFAGASNVTELSTRLGIEQSLLSHHLGALRKGRLVACFRRGKEVFYDIPPEIRASSSAQEMDLKCCRIELKSGGPLRSLSEARIAPKRR
jgi:DNA-binding transcriptional ArsR family regulator